MEIQTYNNDGTEGKVVYGLILGTLHAPEVSTNDGLPLRLVEIRPDGNEPTINTFVERVE